MLQLWSLYCCCKGWEGTESKTRGTRERSELSSTRDSCLATLTESFGLKSLEILRFHLLLFLSASYPCVRALNTSIWSCCPWTWQLSLWTSTAQGWPNPIQTKSAYNYSWYMNYLQLQLVNEESVASGLVNRRSFPLHWESPLTICIPKAPSCQSLCDFWLIWTTPTRQKGLRTHTELNPQATLQNLWTSGITK